MDMLLLELTSHPLQNATDELSKHIPGSPSAGNLMHSLQKGSSYKERRLTSMNLLKERFEYNTVKIR